MSFLPEGICVDFGNRVIHLAFFFFIMFSLKSCALASISHGWSTRGLALALVAAPGARKRERQTRNLGFPVCAPTFFGVTRPRGNARKRDFRLVTKLHIAFCSLDCSQQQEKKHTSRWTVKMSQTNALIANLGG